MNRRTSYVACPTPRKVHRPHAIWAPPVRRHIIGPVALLAVGFGIATLAIVAIGV